MNFQKNLIANRSNIMKNEDHDILHDILRYQKLTEEFIEKYINKLEMCSIFEWRILSESFTGNFLKKYILFLNM